MKELERNETREVRQGEYEIKKESKENQKRGTEMKGRKGKKTQRKEES